MYLNAPARLPTTLNATLFIVSFTLFCLFHDYIGDEATAAKESAGLRGFLFPFFPYLLRFFSITTSCPSSNSSYPRRYSPAAWLCCF
jgi:hypothetical protein